ncbi:MAG: hypothetical protein ORN58_02620, partial [Sediminibacterium sp.]|nr:hypothetical protein [Sediminibacterium sp.]
GSGGGGGRGNILGRGNAGRFPIFNDTTTILNSSFGYYSTARGEKGIQFDNFFYIDSGLTNSSYGYGALVNNTFGGGNTALGYAALIDNNTGTNNIAIGSNALRSSQSGNYNTVVGFYGLMNSTSGKGNTLLGGNSFNADTDTSSNTLYLVTTDNSGNNYLKIRGTINGRIQFPQGYSGRGKKLLAFDNNGTLIDTTNIVQDTAIANRVIDAVIDTNTQILTLIKPNGNNKSIQLKINTGGGSGGGSGQSNDSLLHTYPYNYKDTVKLIAITDKVIQIGTANQPMLNLTEFLKIDLALNVQTNLNINARNAKFIRYNNMFVATQNNQLLTSIDGVTFTQYTTSQTMSGNNSMTLISAIELTNDTLIVINSDGTGNYIIAYLNNNLTTIAYRSQLFQLRNPSSQSIINVTKCHITNNIIYLTPELSFSNYLITL